MKLKTIFLWITCMLVVSIGLSACGGDDEPKVAGGAGGNASSPSGNDIDTDGNSASQTETEQIPSPLDDMETVEWSFNGPNFTIPEADIEGGFVFAVNRIFFYGQFNGQSVSIVAQRMAPEAVYALPGGRVFYRGNGTETRNAVLVQIPSETTFLADYPLSTDGLLLSWNADGTWLTFQDNGLYVAAADGSFKSERFDDADQSIWLDDDTFLYSVEDDEGALIALMRYDPATDTSTEIPIGFDPFEDNLLTLEADLLEAGFRFASPNLLDLSVLAPNSHIRYTINQPENRSATGICDEWGIERRDPANDEFEMIYSDDSTHALSNIHVLPDESVLILRWFREDCAFSNVIQSELLRVFPDGTVQLITDRVLANTNQVQIFSLERRYTASPDGRFVMWIGRDGGVEGDTTLELYDLEAGVQKRVAQMPALSGGGRDVFFSSVTWMQ